MVYRGKPSAGCDACRKAKKRCDLGQPSCSRCRKLKKPCSGYRDTTQLQIHDESESVRVKVERQKVASAKAIEDSDKSKPSYPLTPESSSGTSGSTCSEATPTEYPYYMWPRDLPFVGSPKLAIHEHRSALSIPAPIEPRARDMLSETLTFNIPPSIKPAPDEVATNFFFCQFTSSNGQWTFLRELFSNKQPADRVLDLTVRACGMATLGNIHGVGAGVGRSRSLYAEALRLLNTSLRDSTRCRTDQSLIAVHLLGVYENLTCDSRESIMSWKAHMHGAQRLLQVRGKAQFKTYTGRQLFREHRAQILIHTLWDDKETPSFLWKWNDELKRQSYPREVLVMTPADVLGPLCLEYATLRHKFRIRAISDANAMSTARSIEERMIQWSIDTMNSRPIWGYQHVKVEESPHVWNATVHGFSGYPAVPSVWNLYRTIRIMLTRTQEQLLRRFDLPQKDVEAQMAYLKFVRQEQADGICATIPTQLGHASPAPNSPCILVSAYTSIWPLFFAGTCALERVGLAAWKRVLAGNPLNEEATSEKTAQAAWIINRLCYISKHLGLRWADGLAATLNGDFQKHHNIPTEGRETARTEPDPWRRKLHESDLGPLMMRRWQDIVVEYGMLEAQDPDVDE